DFILIQVNESARIEGEISSRGASARGHRKRPADAASDLLLGLLPARFLGRRALEQQLGEDRGPRVAGPAAILKVDRHQEARPEGAAALPFDLRVDRPDPGHVERHAAADLDPRFAAGAEAGFGKVDQADFDAAPAVRAKPGGRVDREPLRLPEAILAVRTLRCHRQDPAPIAVVPSISPWALTKCCLGNGLSPAPRAVPE